MFCVQKALRYETISYREIDQTGWRLDKESKQTYLEIQNNTD